MQLGRWNDDIKKSFSQPKLKSCFISDIVQGIKRSEMKAHCPCFQGVLSLVENTGRHLVSALDEKLYCSKIE